MEARVRHSSRLCSAKVQIDICLHQVVHGEVEIVIEIERRGEGDVLIWSRRVVLVTTSTTPSIVLVPPGTLAVPYP